MTDNVYFNRGGKAVGTDSDGYDGNYHDVQMVKNMPADLDVRGMTFEQIQNAIKQNRRPNFGQPRGERFPEKPHRAAHRSRG